MFWLFNNKQSTNTCGTIQLICQRNKTRQPVSGVDSWKTNRAWEAADKQSEQLHCSVSLRALSSYR